MSLSKEEKMRLKFLKMAKQFHWDLSKLPKSGNDIKAPIANQHNLSKSSTAKQSLYDSEATESEHDSFPRNEINCKKRNESDMNGMNSDRDTFHFDTTSNDTKHSSLELTQENITKLNLSYNENESESTIGSSSSVLSKHHFTLLQISFSDGDEENIGIKEEKKILKRVDMNSNDAILCNESLTAKQFKKERDKYTVWLFDKLNENAFDSKLILNQNVTYSWCKTLNKTAGDCRLITRNKRRKAHIRLATKVLDSLQKLKQTLCHEMCHAMAWIVHSCRKPPHGKHFKYWGSKAQRAFRDVCVTTCHNYKIQYKFQWKCSQCQYVYGRHSKSIKAETHRCGVCKGKLEFLGRLKPDGTFAKTQQKKPSAFAIFMKQHMSAIKKQFPGATHGDVMKILSQKYKLSKQH